MDYGFSTKTIYFKDMWNVFAKYFIVIALIAALAVSVFALIVSMSYVPRYQSTATMYILRKNDDVASSSSLSSDFSLALNVVNDCTYILKMNSVIDEVIRELDLDIPNKTIRDCISTANPTKTRILEVTVEASTPELAKAIVDSLCVVGAEKINEDMGFDQISISEYGILDNTPCNKTRISSYFTVGFIAAVVAYGVFLGAFIFDDGIHSDEDVQKYLGLSVLGDIPDAGSIHGRKHYSEYGYGYSKKSKRIKGRSGEKENR